MFGTLETVSVLFNLVYLVLLIRKNIWCWLFGFIGCVLAIPVMFDFGLRVEPYLYGFYAIMSIYGFLNWKKEDSQNESYTLIELSWTKHLLIIAAGALGYLGFGWIFENFSEGERTYLDSFTSSFAVIATFLQIYKVRSNFIYWIIVNSATIYLYYSQEAYQYTWLMVIYLALSIYGLLKWKS